MANGPNIFQMLLVVKLWFLATSHTESGSSYIDSCAVLFLLVLVVIVRYSCCCFAISPCLCESVVKSQPTNLVVVGLVVLLTDCL